MSSRVATHYPGELSSGSKDTERTGDPHGATRPVDRAPSIDVLRGAVMILMALDHTRDFFAPQLAIGDLSDSPALLYFTRWITHLCAPTFIFLAGLAAYLQLTRGKTKAELSFFLLTRGLWLILLEVTVNTYGWTFAVSMPVLQVLWAIGISMIMLAGLIWLPLTLIAATGLVLVAGHNVLDHLHADSLGAWANLWHLAHEPGFLVFAGRPVTYILYPTIPWNGVMALGFCFGRIMSLPAGRRIRITALCGTCLFALFAILRGLHAYGDPTVWTNSSGVATSIKVFLNVEKYPPSLQYCAVTLGVSLLFLASVDSLLKSGRASWLRRSVEVYGRVPLVFYIIHIYLIHAVALVLCALTGHDWHRLTMPVLELMRLGPPPGYGFSVPVVYLIWMMIVISLYWPVRRYADYKRTHPEKWWLSYL
jgi:uncharacterized membrane protein